MATRPDKCPNCARLEQRVAQLERMLSVATARIEELEKKLAAAGKNSSNSSKPPSSDIVKPPPQPLKKGRRRKRRRGGQPGHQRNTRPLYPPEQVDTTWIYESTGVGDDWEPLDQFRVIQQVDLAPKLVTVTEHRARLYRHRRTGKVIAADLPPEVIRGGLIGPRLTALAAYQKGACHMSYTLIQRFLNDVFGFPVSTGELAKVIRKASAALAESYGALQTQLPDQPILNIDETGHPECGHKLWTWGFHAPGENGFTWFHIDPSRSSQVLKDFLGETFAGIIGCDYHSAYRKFLRETDARLQFCWAHLIRDVKFLVTLPDPSTKRYGERVLGAMKALFRTWHRRRETSAIGWQRAAERARRQVLDAARRAPHRTEAQNIAARFRDHATYYFLFLTVPGLEPTNNAMERGFRHLVADRKLTQGTRGAIGRRWCERIWTVLATCAQQKRSAFEFIYRSILADFHAQSPPMLLPIVN